MTETPSRARRLHPLPLRVMHWINAVAMIILIGSGWKIYGDEVLFGWLHFPDWMTIGGDWQVSIRLHGNGGNSGALLWHFFAMWILVLNGLTYLAYGFATGRFRRKLLPIRPRDVKRDIDDALHFRLSHADITRYNAVQKLLYVGILVVAAVQVLSGLAIWKPVQFQELTALFGGFQGARLAHFLGMAAIVMFLVVHVTLAMLVPRTLLAMVTGGPRVEQDTDAASPTPEPAALAHQTGD